MEKDDILKDLKTRFVDLKKELKFKSSYEEINEMSYIEDMALSDGFVSNQLSRQLINRMVQTFYSWIPELYALLYPQPYDIGHSLEHKSLSTEEKNEIMQMIQKTIYLVRKNKRIAFSGLDKKEESSFIDELVEFDKKEFNPFMLKIHKKFENLWKEKR
jgi:hypothetical protein